MNRDRIGDGQIDCYGAIDERQTLSHCTQPTMLGENFRCPSSNQCLRYHYYCSSDRCTTQSDEQFWCTRQNDRSNCLDSINSVCFNGTCVKNGRCNRVIDCALGEDEYMCNYDTTKEDHDTLYRAHKQFFVKNVEQKLHLIRFPSDSNTTHQIWDIIPTTQMRPILPPGTRNISSPIAYWCNRGVGVHMYNGSIACFCPPQYYGEKCQYHNDRITVLIHLNLSQSIYQSSSDVNMVLKILVLFLFNNQTITNQVFHVRPATDIAVTTKKNIHFPFSRASHYLQHKRQRSRNQSSIIHDHPYSIRIELYERKLSGNPRFLAVWQYPFYFDYLPVFRFAKVLRFIEPKPCSSNPCHLNEDCHQLINDPSKYLCLCKSHFKGENCSIEDSHCRNGFCASGAICKPNYRGMLSGDEFPYCVCPFERLGEQCHIEYAQCKSTPCLNNGSCFPTSKPNGISCKCTEEYYGENCGLQKPVTKLYFNQTLMCAAAVVQYFHIDFISLRLILSHQRVFRSLSIMIEYRHQAKTAPELILLKAYSKSTDAPPEIYLLSLHLHATDISATVRLSEDNQCSHVDTLISPKTNSTNGDYSPIEYHSVCENRTDLICFRDDVYVCMCEENRRRAECFHYDHQFDQCSHCSSGGRCLRGDRSRPNDVLCLCPACYSGKYCQLSSKSFVLSLDQLFFADLQSTKRNLTLCLLIIIPFVLAFFGLLNNLFAFVTFRRPKCSSGGIGQCLLVLSIISQFSLTVLATRFLHLSLVITGLSPHPNLNSILCKLLTYLSICLSRTVSWLASFVAFERVYTVVFVKGQWLKKLPVARRLVTFIVLIVCGSSAYELIFIRSFVFEDDQSESMCVIEFPVNTQFQWILLHQIVWIIHSIFPLLFNLTCTIVVIYVITRTKLNIRRPKEGT